ncbi:hypothetical protein AB0I10_12010 [Streptomyces sp. NPDC050636]|uniref:NucA/NucB deoxyribonuclease domain-containing protein n=1 Tax=Streptomyces sp. NPDC050636 TaxID=3154510 RepID=UPI00344A3EFF
MTSLKSSAAPLSYPDPPRSITQKECEEALGYDGSFYLKSRFAVCAGLHMVQIWKERGVPKGTSEFNVWLLGTVSKDTDRQVTFEFQFTRFKKIGTAHTSAFMVTPDPKVAKKWPSTAQASQGGSIPGPKSWDALKLTSPAKFIHTLTVAPGQGSNGTDDLVSAAYVATINTKWPSGYVDGTPSAKLDMLVPRWDAAKYLKNSTGGSDPTKRGAAAFSYMPSLVYHSKAGAPEKAVADHIKKAYTDPKSTKPTNPAKRLPGQSGKEPLHRIFRDTKRHDRNRTVAVANCKKYWGPKYTDGGKECDEFPFASTYEGAAEDEYGDAKKNNFSVQPLDGKQNQDAGTLLKSFYGKMRLIDGLDDGFLVKVD